MQIARIAQEGPDGVEPRVVVAADAEPDRWFDLRTAERRRRLRAGATASGARRLAEALAPSSLSAALENGPTFLEIAGEALIAVEEEALVGLDPRFLAPVDPPAYRDFMAFEKHFRSFHDRAGTTPPDVLYELPVSYIGSVQAMLGPEDEVLWPAYSEVIDYELELGIVIGAGGRNIRPEQASDHILGLTVFNDFSARDIQAHEMTGRLGPSKGKHFGSAVGPRIVTVDSIGLGPLRMQARVNGQTWSDASSEAILFPLEELVAWASTGENLVPGTLLGTGTVGGGCGAELQRFLSPGDTVELEIEGIGVLRNTIGLDPASDWRPRSRVGEGSASR